MAHNEVLRASEGDAISNIAPERTGSAGIKCLNGIISPMANSCNTTVSTVYASCNSQTVTWGGGNCGRSVAAAGGADAVHGIRRDITNQTTVYSGYTGDATILCNNGDWQVQPGATCNASYRCTWSGLRDQPDPTCGGPYECGDTLPDGNTYWGGGCR